MNITILRYDRLSSTNTEAANQARMGVPEGLCVVANEQFEGRGREGRKWVSNSGSGLYFSIVLRPPIDTRFFPVLPLMGAVAVHDALHQVCGVKPDIKWPNDILIEEKKISGILCETCETKNGLAVIMGIGINLITDDLDEELKKTATSVKDEIDSDADYDFLLRSLTHFLSAHYSLLNRNSDIGSILGAWSARSSYTSGKKVIVRTRHETVTGTTAGLDPLGSLLVRLDDGRLRAVTAGDVEYLRAEEPEPDEDEEELPDEAEDVYSEDMCEND